ncbi:nucleoside-diphosphate-sugar epimerase [Sphingomonas insulae]|uniref:NAD-dependent epimerase/dehydratase family protein n=1 Tax=Sphingomonas insulae TaxID=424800 RepID=A0ABN1HTQ9_9SPHN|nr:NAD-dependent epimerase/dehydratase family protein [Sphingomonas insulae]NIJ28145.1 nucleoside-diphosphate-sugar epimerase [Sphingomonas insulae]
MMRVLVLGADGFVGRRAIAALAASDWATPIAGSRRVREGTGVARIAVDATDRQALASALDGIDAVVNCVGGNASVIRRNAEALFAAAGSRRIVHLSSMAVYGSATGTITESAPLLADTGSYATAKAAAERLAADTDTVLLRPGCIYGAGSVQWSCAITALLARRRIGDLGRRGDGYSNLVHVDDVARAIVAALRSDSAGAAYNLAMADAPDWNAYFLAVARANGLVPVRRVPAWQLRGETTMLAIPLGLARRATRQAPPPIPAWLATLWQRDIRLDPTRAERELGMRWTPLAAGVAEAAQAVSVRRPVSEA